ncbi:hypothetical protein, partial [Streptococcus pseudopneumoniae]|uniref:hypothetical protein n=1 Tax=Streptococcus pseudopneumoniae TaxID=257758 RepID=UPI0019D6324D
IDFCGVSCPNAGKCLPRKSGGRPTVGQTSRCVCRRRDSIRHRHALIFARLCYTSSLVSVSGGGTTRDRVK